MSQQSVRNNYIQADVFSATPQKLQLLLIEAAMKNVLKTKKFWEEKNLDDAFNTLSRAQDIVAEILSSLDVEGNPEIAKKLASIYVFVFRRLAEAGMSYEPEKLDDAYRVLCSERETWKMVCEKFGSSKTDSTVRSVGETAPGSAAGPQRALGGAAWTPSATANPSNGNSGTYSALPTSVTGSAAFTPTQPSAVGQSRPSISGDTYKPVAKPRDGAAPLESQHAKVQLGAPVGVPPHPNFNPLGSPPPFPTTGMGNGLQGVLVGTGAPSVGLPLGPTDLFSPLGGVVPQPKPASSQEPDSSAKPKKPDLL